MIKKLPPEGYKTWDEYFEYCYNDLNRRVLEAMETVKTRHKHRITKLQWQLEDAKKAYDEKRYIDAWEILRIVKRSLQIEVGGV